MAENNALEIALQMEEEGLEFYLKAADKASDLQGRKWLKALAAKENWTRDDIEDVRGAFKEADDAIREARDTLSRLRI